MICYMLLLRSTRDSVIHRTGFFGLKVRKTIASAKGLLITWQEGKKRARETAKWACVYIRACTCEFISRQ